MFDTGKRPGGCGAGENIVSYIYGEMTEAERSHFEDHLGDCSACADELAAFSAISLSVAELRESEIPAGTVSKAKAQENAGGFIDRLFAAIGASFGLKALAGAAAVALILVLGILAVSFLNLNGTSQPVANSEIPKTAAPADEDAPVALPESEIAETTVETEREAAPKAPAPAPVQTRETPVRKPAAPTPAPEKRTVVPPAQLAENNEAPRLSEAADEEFEDESLRLTDLFTDISED